MLMTELLMTTDLGASVQTLANLGPVPASSVGDACAALPADVTTQMDQVEGWAKGFFLAVIAISFFACLIAVGLGKVINSPRAGQGGAVGLLVVAATGIGYAVGPDILQAILGEGC